MPRNITVTFDDGSSHVYQNAPDDVTPDAVERRAAKEFGKRVASMDGGRQPAPATPAGQIPGAGPYQAPAAVQEVPMGRRVMQVVRPTVEALGAAGGGTLGTPLGPAGVVGGAGLGYGIAKTGLDIAEQALGYQRAPSSAKEALVKGAEDVLTGGALEAGGRGIVAPAVSKAAEYVLSLIHI